MHIAETPFAIIKSILGVRRFLLRGLEKGAHRMVVGVYRVQHEKAAGDVVGLRAELAKMPAEMAG